MTSTMNVTDAARDLRKVARDARDHGVRTLLVEGGVPLAQIVPAPALAAQTGRALANIIPAAPHLTPTEAAALQNDILEARRSLPRPTSSWE